MRVSKVTPSLPNMLTPRPPYTPEDNAGSGAQAHDQPRDRETSGQGEPFPAGSSPQDQSIPGTRGLGSHPEEISEPRGRDRRYHGLPGRSDGRNNGFDRHGHPFGWCPAGFGRGWGGLCGGHRPWGHYRGRFRQPPHGSAVDCDFSAFLQGTAAQLGISLDQMYNSRQSRNENVAFVPPVDIFDAPNKFLVHVSIPGAQKPDISSNMMRDTRPFT